MSCAPGGSNRNKDRVDRDSCGASSQVLQFFVSSFAFQWLCLHKSGILHCHGSKHFPDAAYCFLPVILLLVYDPSEMKNKIIYFISFIPCTSLFPSLLSPLLLSHPFIFPACYHSSPPSFLLLHVKAIPLPLIFHSPIPLFPFLSCPAFLSHPDNSAFSFSHSGRN
jgi:hypothetical protein